jgi:hypothetical protein
MVTLGKLLTDINIDIHSDVLQPSYSQEHQLKGLNQ